MDIVKAATHNILSARLLIVAATIGVILALAGCAGGSDDSGPSVSPVDEIIDDEIRVEDISSDSANVVATTTLPVICSVVFGTDASFGRMSTDPDMGGLAHTDHHAPLRGLERDTVYHFRLQGTGPDGTLYVSDDMTFWTATAPKAGDAERGPNFASSAHGARVLDVSSTFGDSAAWQAANAIDSDASTEWSSNGDGDDAYITIELPDEVRLISVGFWTRTMGTSGQVEQFQVVTDEGETLGPFTLPDANRLYTFEVSARARTLRFEVVSSSGGNTGAVEVAAYGDASQ